MTDWHLRDARLDGAEPLEILITDGRIAEIGPALNAPDGCPTRDLGGRAVVRGFVDLHTHLDKTYAPLADAGGDLMQAIMTSLQHRAGRPLDAFATAAHRALRQAIGNGVTALRTHVDVVGWDPIEPLPTLLGVRDAMRGLIDVQVVAMGMQMTRPGNRAAVEAALDAGADLVGGAPALCPDPAAEIDVAFALADAYDVPVDLHIDETTDPGVLTLEYLADQTLARGWQGRVTAGHCCSLAFVDPETRKRVIDKVTRAGITVVALPSTNLVLQGRRSDPAPRAVAPVDALDAADAAVCAASDNVHDAFNPFGSYDPLHIAWLTAHVAHLTGRAELRRCLDMVTTRPARAFYGDDRPLAVGQPADLVVLDAPDPLEALVQPAPRCATFKGGRLLVERQTTTRWSLGPSEAQA